MLTMEVSSLIIAMVSLAISGWTAWKSGLLQRHDVVLARRLELHGLLQEADKLLIDHPQLSRAFRSSEQYTPIEEWTADERDMFRNYFFVYVNVFEAAHSVFGQTSKLDRAEGKVRDAWQRTITSFFDDCPAARDVWVRYRETYYDDFQTFIDVAIGNVAHDVAHTRSALPIDKASANRNIDRSHSSVESGGNPIR